MAILYTVKCPKCGTVFSVPKGVFMSWDFSKPIPEHLREETPFNCPTCNHTMSTLDETFDDCVVEVMCAD